MEIFFYQSPLEVPFATPYSREFFTDKQVLLISNKSEILDKFETHRAVIMEDGITKIIGTKVFVPVVVKTVFLTWLKAEYSNIDWQAKTEFADFRPEVTDELQAFFQQLRIVEKCEGGTMQPDPTKKVELGENKFAEATADASKYVSMGFAIIVVLSLLISLISLKSVNELRQSQIDSTLTHISQDEDKSHWCERLNQIFGNEIQNQRYIQICQPANPVVNPLQPPIDEQTSKAVMSENYELALITISRGDYTAFANTAIERGSALWYAKEISRIPSDDSLLKTEDILKRIIQKYFSVGNIQKKCAGIQKIYEFSCKQQKLTIITQEIETKFSECKLTCSSPSTTER